MTSSRMPRAHSIWLIFMVAAVASACDEVELVKGAPATSTPRRVQAEGMLRYGFAMAHLMVDVCIVGLRAGIPHVLLIERAAGPFQNHWYGACFFRNLYLQLALLQGVLRWLCQRQCGRAAHRCSVSIPRESDIVKPQRGRSQPATDRVSRQCGTGSEGVHGNVPLHEPCRHGPRFAPR